ncbi:MFS transporter, partial [Oenococcus oeni]|uniref:MFS transporter n=1 Tax=Oenococcus oeni TaxID=1247 RepID=UPI0030CD6008
MSRQQFQLPPSLKKDLFLKRFIFKKIFFWAGLLFIIGVICSALAPNFLILLIGRLIQALSTGLAIPLLITEIMQQIPQKKQGSYMGIGGMVIAFGIFARANLWRRHYSGPIMETYIPVCTSDRFDCLVDRAFFYRT